MRGTRRLWQVIAVLEALLLGANAPQAEISLDNPPPGANNFSSKPSAAHPDPVVLVHGLSATMSQNWGYLSPLLAARGYCVFELTYGLNPLVPFFGGVLPVERHLGRSRRHQSGAPGRLPERLLRPLAGGGRSCGGADCLGRA
jgi:hypothetical protein